MTKWTLLLSALSNANVKYLVVGGLATIAHGYARATDDLDLWLAPTFDNAQRALDALSTCGVPTAEIPLDDLMDVSSFIRLGEDGGRVVDLMTHFLGAEFDAAWTNRHRAMPSSSLSPDNPHAEVNVDGRVHPRSKKENALIADIANGAHARTRPRAGNEIRPPCRYVQIVGWVNSTGDKEQSVGQRR